MKIFVVLAVAVVFALLRFRRANLLLWALAWWVGIYTVLRFGFTAPIPSSVISIYMGILTLAILSYMSSSADRREEIAGPLVRFMTDKRYTAFLIAVVVLIPALAAANVYVQMSAPIQPPLFSRTVHPASPTNDHGPRQENRSRCRRESLLHLEKENPEEYKETHRGRAPGLLPELRLLPRRQPGRHRHVHPRVGSDPDEPSRNDSAVA
jgi:hypothetical protein